MNIEVYALPDFPTSDVDRIGPIPLEVALQERLSDVLASAREHPAFSPVQWPHWEVWLCDGSGNLYRDFGVPWCLMSDGLLRWRPDIKDVTLADLQRTAHANLLNVRLDVIHFWVVEGLGDGEDEVLWLWPVFQNWLSVAADLGGLGVIFWAFIHLVRLKWKSWHDRGGAPKDLIDSVLSGKSDGWHLRQFSAIYEIEEDEGRVVLGVFGFRESEKGSRSFDFLPDETASKLLAKLEEINGESFGVYGSDTLDTSPTPCEDQDSTD